MASKTLRLIYLTALRELRLVWVFVQHSTSGLDDVGVQVISLSFEDLFDLTASVRINKVNSVW